jgi:phage-related protein
MQISIICPQPYFYETTTNIITFNGIIDLFEFPFSNPIEGMPFSEIMTNQVRQITNSGYIEGGMILEIEATGNIVEPKVYNLDTMEHFTLNIELLAGDKLTINTRDRNKSVKLERDGVVSNVINTIAQDSTWLKAAIGVDNFTYATVYGDENLNLTIYYNNLFQGV